MARTRLLIAVSLAATSACSSGDAAGGGDGRCGPLEVTVGGKPVAGLAASGFAARITWPDAWAWHLELTDGPGASCDEVLGRGRPVRPGETLVAADLASARSQFTGVRVGTMSITRPGAVKVIGAIPEKVGDPITMCIDDAHAGKDAREVRVRGTLAATYCGERK